MGANKLAHSFFSFAMVDRMQLTASLFAPDENTNKSSYYPALLPVKMINRGQPPYRSHSGYSVIRVQRVI